MQEVELKILGVDPPELGKKLSACGAEKIGTFLVHEKAFDYPDARIRSGNNLLRLRRVGDRNELVFKDETRQVNDFKIGEETEIIVNDFVAVELILTKLGLLPYRDRQKIRTTYRSNDLEFEIDEYPHIPPYLEIEGDPDAIRAAIPALDFSMDDTTDMTATQVLKHYGVNSSELHFSLEELKKRNLV